MAEERICICKLEGNATESVCGGSISRQEVIGKMADAIWETGGTEFDMARAALAALLGEINGKISM